MVPSETTVEDETQEEFGILVPVRTFTGRTILPLRTPLQRRGVTPEIETCR